MGKMVSANGTAKERGDSKRHEPKRSRVEWRGYLSPQISTQEKKLYREWRAVEGNCEKTLKGVLDAGYKISVDFQAGEGAYRAGLYCQAVDSPNAGWCLTAFAGNWWEAVNRVVFIHDQLLNADWTSLTGKGKWRDDWID